MSEDLSPELRAFVASELRVTPDVLTPSTELVDDLRLDGDDAAEFMQQYVGFFHVDLSAFEFEKHFGPEAAWNPIVWLYWLMRPSRRPGLIPITLGDLECARRAAKWTTPNRPARRR